jgi:hypothetical protein
MAKVLLTQAELLELDQNLIEAYEFFRKLRAESSVARLIHYPSVPSEFTESLTVHCADLFFGEGWIGKFGGSTCDILLERLGERKSVEVKATGQTNFQEFKLKDLGADFLVWIHFGDRYINGGGKLSIYVLRNPRTYFAKPLRLKLHEFLKSTQGSPDLKHIQAESLQDLLNRHRAPGHVEKPRLTE